MILGDVKTLLGISDDSRDTLISLIIKLTSQRLAAILQVEDIPQELEYIVTEVSIIRFNRIGSEGVTEHVTGSLSMTFSDDDFSKFDKDLKLWKKGKVRFI